MPNGHVHARFHKRYLPAVIVVGIAGAVAGYFTNIYASMVSLWFIFWYWCGRYVDPDWDLLGITAAEGRILRELGPIAPFVLASTTLYAAGLYYLVDVFKIRGSIGGSHRTKLSHSILIGTPGRMVVICTMILAVVNLVEFATRSIFKRSIVVYIFEYPYFALAFLVGMFLGLGLADFIHIQLDRKYGGE